MNQHSPADNADLSRDQQRRVNGMLRTSRFDAVTSFLMALVLLLGALVLSLVVIWMLSDAGTNELSPQPHQFVWGTVKPDGHQHDFLEPGVDETVDLSQPSMQDSLLAVTAAVSHVAASAQTSLVNQSGKLGAGGNGDSRLPGPLDEAASRVPRFERWQLNFNAQNLDSYAQQLDHHGIELALIGGGIQGLDYASHLAFESPRLRHGDSSKEKRLYFLWTQSGPLMQMDRRLLQRAISESGTGILVENRQMLKFISPELENRLAKLELEYASANQHPAIDSVAKTVFVSRPYGDGYQFVVTDQRYRKPTGRSLVTSPGNP